MQAPSLSDRVRRCPGGAQSWASLAGTYQGTGWEAAGKGRGLAVGDSMFRLEDTREPSPPELHGSVRDVAGSR